eukprot:48635_1
MAEIVSFTEFQDVYIMTHPTIKSRNQKAQTEWNQIKLKHLTETQIKSKRLPSRQFPDGFHLEAKQLMSNWKRIYGQQKQLNLARLQSKKAHFFNPTANPYFKSKHKKCNAPPSPKRRRKSTHTTSNVPLITRPRTSPSSDEKECIKILKECEELSSKWNMFCDSIEFAQYKDIIHSSEFREYVKRIKHLPVHDTRAWSQLRGTQLFKTLNESSNLEQKILAFAASHEFKVLSQGFACLPVRLSSDVVRVIRTYGGISKHMVMFAAFKGLLKCYEVRKFHQLRPNYIIPEKERVTQSQVIDDIMDVNTSIANCAYLPAHIAAKSLKTLKKKKDELHKTLHRMQKHCISQRAYHDGFTQKVRKAAKLSKVKIYHDKPCRPSVEDLNPSFKATLLSIVEENACADPKRRSKVKSTLKTCDNVRKLLADAGIVLSSSTVYRRFLPSQTNSFYAKKYHTKAHLYDIKLARSQNSSHEFHVAGHFGLALTRFAKEFVATGGKDKWAYLSLDDKDKIKIGVTPGKQTLLIGFNKRRTELPDHDFVQGSRYKINCSVYKLCDIMDDLPFDAEAVTKSGPIRIFLRSAKHDKASAACHYEDIAALIREPSLRDVWYDLKGILKAILCRSDGGPDENVKYAKTLATYILIMIEFQPPMIIVMNTIPKQSCYNEVEHEMKHISDAINGCIFDHQQMGQGVKNGKTIDFDIEQFNFEAAMIDITNTINRYKEKNLDMKASYYRPSLDRDDRDVWMFDKLRTTFGSEKAYYKYIATHCMQGKYMIQLAQCDDDACVYCKGNANIASIRSVLRKSNNGRFLPTMCGVTHQNNGELAYTKSNEHTPQTIRYSSFLESLHYDLPMNLAIDHWNPQFTEQFEKDAQCPNCKYHFNTKTKLKEHVKMRICVHDESKVNESTDGFWLSPSQELSEIEEILDCMPPCSYLVQYKNGETEQITITELSMPANLRAKVQNWQLQPKLKQRYHNSSKYDVSLEQKNETMKMFKLKKSKRKPNKNAKKKAKKKKTKPKPKKTKPKPKTKTKKKKKKKHSDTESSSDDDEHILANVRLRKRAGTNTKKEEKKHSDTESSSDDDISIHEWRRQQREAAKNKKKNTNTNNNDK